MCLSSKVYTSASPFTPSLEESGRENSVEVANIILGKDPSQADLQVQEASSGLRRSLRIEDVSEPARELAPAEENFEDASSDAEYCLRIEAMSERAPGAREQQHAEENPKVPSAFSENVMVPVLEREKGNQHGDDTGSSSDKRDSEPKIEHRFLTDDPGDRLFSVETDITEEARKSKSSSWFSFVPQNAGLSQLNVVVRRAVSSGSLRRLQGRVLGFRCDSLVPSTIDVWLLGVLYTLCEDVTSSPAGNEAYSQFLTDFTSRIWLTYRRGFEPIGPSQLTSDVGWGCMIRSGQMLLAQALIHHYLGRDWRRNPSEPNTQEYLKVLQCFGDEASPGCPFSLHNIVSAGCPYGLVAGSWLGPYTLCRTLELLAHSTGDQSEGGKGVSVLPMKVYVVSGDADGERGGAPCICIDDVEKLFYGEWSPLLLLVPLVLGLEKVNTRYLPSIRATFTFPQSLGIAGGKPGASTYIVGVQGGEALYLDPHEVQLVVDVSSEEGDIDTSSYHCSNVKKMPLDAIDPSIALGFYCHNQEEFNDLCKRSSEMAAASNGAPMFTVMNSCNKAEHKAELFASEDETLRQIEASIPGDVSAEVDWQML